MKFQHPSTRPSRSSRSTTIVGAISAFAVLLFVSYWLSGDREESSAAGLGQPKPLLSPSSRIKVVVAPSKHSTAQKLLQDLQHSLLVEQVIVLDPAGEYVQSCTGASQRLEMLPLHLQWELLKYCALQYYKGGVLYLDAESPLMDTLDHILSYNKNLAVLNDPFVPRSMHGALLYLNKNSQKDVASNMLQILMTTAVPVLDSSPLLLAKSLHDIIAMQAGVGKLSAGPAGDWYLLQHACTVHPLGGREVNTPISNYALNSYR